MKDVDKQLEHWAKFGYEFQGLNARHLDHIETLENDKAGLIHLIKSQESEMTSLRSGHAKVDSLEARNVELKKELESVRAQLLEARSA